MVSLHHIQLLRDQLDFLIDLIAMLGMVDEWQQCGVNPRLCDDNESERERIAERGFVGVKIPADICSGTANNANQQGIWSGFLLYYYTVHLFPTVIHFAMSLQRGYETT